MVDPDARTHMSESKPDPFVGKSFDGYKIEEIIGRGGMGTVYKATQLSLGRPVALKVLTADLALDKQFLERFHREADVLSKLSHPNIVTVFDRGELDGRPYLAMEYVEGTSLRDILCRGPCDPQEALRIVSSVLSALAHAHEKGIVHRDIKPENVLLSRNDVVKVADFGLSRLVGTDQTRLTRTHLVLGTYEYMAPEQRERSREADHRSDIYATGVILYEMLTGELPIGRFQLPSDQRDDCDSRIDRLIERSLDKSPERRYQNADEMAGAVSQILERPSEPGLDVPEPGAGAPRSEKGYRPVRFEYHADNVATIDHVLGTLCYALGFLTLFGFGFHRSFVLSVPFFAFFIAGWYLRETSEELRKFKRSARTSQAVVAILCGFTGLLLPFTIYSLWVLFGHKGRTYYEARARGLGTREAAQYTYRLLEEPYPGMPARAEPAPVESPEPRPPTPSQIPVQSIVTSEVLPRPAGPRGPKQRTRLVTAGMWLAGLTIIAGLITVLTGARLRSDEIETPLTVGIAVAGGLLALGVLRVLIGRRFKGLVPAVITGFVLVVACVGFDEMKHDQNRDLARQIARDYLGRVQTQFRLGSYAKLPPRDFERNFMKDLRTAGWLQEATKYPGEFAREVHLRRRGSTLWVDVPYDIARRGYQLTNTITCAMREIVKQRLGADFIPAQGSLPTQLSNYMKQEPIPIPVASND